MRCEYCGSKMKGWFFNRHCSNDSCLNSHFNSSDYKKVSESKIRAKGVVDNIGKIETSSSFSTNPTTSSSSSCSSSSLCSTSSSRSRVVESENGNRFWELTGG